MKTHSPHYLGLRFAWLCAITALGFVAVPLCILLSLEGIMADSASGVVWPIAFVPLWLFLSCCWVTPSVVQPFHLAGAIMSISTLWLSAALVLVLVGTSQRLQTHSPSTTSDPAHSQTQVSFNAHRHSEALYARIALSDSNRR